MLIHEPEQPERDTITMPDFRIIYGKITVRQVSNLLKIFTFASHLKQVFTINQKVSALGISHIMIHFQLAEEKGFPFIAFINYRAKDVH